MGLSIKSESGVEYKRSYQALHWVRWVAYKSLGGKAPYAQWHSFYTKFNTDKMYKRSFVIYPNLLMHSDCDGSYTPNGKVGKDDNGLVTGNSLELLRELNWIKSRLEKNPIFTLGIEPYHMMAFDQFYRVVEEIVLNGDGVIEFN